MLRIKIAQVWDAQQKNKNWINMWARDSAEAWSIISCSILIISLQSIYKKQRVYTPSSALGALLWFVLWKCGAAASDFIICWLNSWTVKYVSRLSVFGCQIIFFREHSFHLFLAPLMICPGFCHMLRVTDEHFAVWKCDNSVSSLIVLSCQHCHQHWITTVGI